MMETQIIVQIGDGHSRFSGMKTCSGSHAILIETREKDKSIEPTPEERFEGHTQLLIEIANVDAACILREIVNNIADSMIADATAAEHEENEVANDG